MKTSSIETKRLIMRQWGKSDLAIFAKIKTDPKVMEFFPSTLDEKQSNEFAKRN